jgi:hypothetical protein
MSTIFFKTISTKRVRKLELKLSGKESSPEGLLITGYEESQVENIGETGDRLLRLAIQV